MKKKKFLDVGNTNESLRKRFTNQTYYFPSSSREVFKNIHFEAYVPTINGIRERPDHPDYQIYVNLQELNLTAFNREEFTEEIEKKQFTFMLVTLKNSI